MLRWLVVLLLGANLAFWAWLNTPMAEALGLPLPTAPREPGRLARQIQPDAIRVLPPAAAEAASAPAAAASGAMGSEATTATDPADVAMAAPPAASAASSGATVAAVGATNTPPEALCLQAGPLTDAAFTEVTQALQKLGLHSDRWIDMRREFPGVWAVYMGRFADADALQRKLDELTRLKLPHEELAGHATLSPGITLGRYPSEAEAQAKLTQWQNRGVRTARVAALTSPTVEHRLRVEPNTVEQLRQVQALEGGSTRWQACSKD